MRQLTFEAKAVSSVVRALASHAGGYIGLPLPDEPLSPFRSGGISRPVQVATYNKRVAISFGWVTPSGWDRVVSSQRYI